MKSFKNSLSIATMLTVLFFITSVDAQVDVSSNGNTTIMPQLILPPEILPPTPVSSRALQKSNNFTTIEKPIITKKFKGNVTVTYNNDYKIVAITVPSQVKEKLLTHYSNSVVNSRTSCPQCYVVTMGEVQGGLCAVDCVAGAIADIILFWLD